MPALHYSFIVCAALCLPHQLNEVMASCETDKLALQQNQTTGMQQLLQETEQRLRKVEEEHGHQSASLVSSQHVSTEYVLNVTSLIMLLLVKQSPKKCFPDHCPYSN